MSRVVEEITFRRRIERALLPQIRQLEKHLGGKATLAMLTHYQILLHAAFDKSKLPDGFWAKWRYLWALSLKSSCHDGNSGHADFAVIDDLVEKIFETYLTGAIFDRGRTPGSEKEFLARMGVVFNTREIDFPVFPEQTRSWASDRFQPFNESYFQTQFGLTFEEIFQWLDSLINLLTTNLNAWLKDFQKIIADIRSVEAQESTIEAMQRRGAALKIEERLNSNGESSDKLHIFTLDELRLNIPEDTAQKLMGLLEICPGSIGDEYIFPHNSNPLDYRIFVSLPEQKYFFLDAASAHRIAAKAFEKAILEQDALRDRYLKNRDAATERRVAESLKKLFPKAEVYKNYYSQKGQFEKDLLLLDGSTVLIVESKNAKIRGFRGTADDLVKFDRDFEHSVQFCYDQANDVKQRIIGSNGQITFYDKKGREYFSLNKSEIKQIFILCVTLVPRGPFGTDLSLQLKKSTDEVFPLAVSMFDLETICQYFSGKQFLEYLAARGELHGRVHTGDELNFAGYFLKFEHLSVKDGTFLEDDFSGVFDRRWHRERGIEIPEPTNPPVEVAMTRRGSRIVIDKSHGNSETIQIAPEIYEHITGQPIIKIKGAQRNKPCPCGSGRKFKHCHGVA